MAKGEVNAVIVGSDRAAQNGDIINKVGTYPLALMAKQYGIPFHVLVPDPRSLAQGSDVPIEERPGAELLSFRGRQLIADAKIAVRYPAFDVTPAELVTHLIGFDDLYTPESFRRRYQQQTGPASSPSPRKSESKYLLVYGIPPRDQCDYLIECTESRASQPSFGSGNATADVGCSRGCAGAAAAQCANDSNFGQYDGDFFRPGRDPKAVSLLQRAR